MIPLELLSVRIKLCGEGLSGYPHVSWFSIIEHETARVLRARGLRQDT